LASSPAVKAPRHRHFGLQHLLTAYSVNQIASEVTLRACHNLPRIGRNIHTGNRLVVPRQLILELVPAARLLEEVDVVLAGYGERLAVGREGVVRNGMVEEVVDFGAGHDGGSVCVCVCNRRLSTTAIGGW
jgi:hypothetical protein